MSGKEYTFDRFTYTEPIYAYRLPSKGPVAEAHRAWGAGQPMIGRCARCGAREQCRSLADQQAWWLLHECGHA